MTIRIWEKLRRTSARRGIRASALPHRRLLKSRNVKNARRASPPARGIRHPRESRAAFCNNNEKLAACKDVSREPEEASQIRGSHIAFNGIFCGAPALEDGCGAPLCFLVNLAFSLLLTLSRYNSRSRGAKQIAKYPQVVDFVDSVRARIYVSGRTHTQSARGENGIRSANSFSVCETTMRKSVVRGAW